MEIARANKAHVKLVLDHLLESLNTFLDAHPQIDNIDMFMAVHNFHVVTVLSLEQEFAGTAQAELFIRETATETFKRAMESKPAYKKNRRSKRR